MRSVASTKVSIVVPCYDEEDGIRDFHDALCSVLVRLPEYQFEILFVDDGSRDGTVDILNELAAEDDRVNVLELSRNFGHQIALSAGLDAASGDAVILMDSDLQHPPELIPRLLEGWAEGHDIVSAVRTYSSSENIYKRLSSSLFYRLINLMSDTEIVPGTADFCLLSRQAYSALRSLPERHRFLRGLTSWIGFRRTFVHYTAPVRQHGTSKYSLKHMIALALTAVFSFSGFPLQITIRLGELFILLGAFYLSYIVGRFFLVGDLVPGWASVLSVVLLMGGVQLLFLGIMGEYVIRIFEETKQRPLYLLRERPSIRERHSSTPKSEE
jgi:dolichol-phosphate mannosyltransferase